MIQKSISSVVYTSLVPLTWDNNQPLRARHTSWSNPTQEAMFMGPLWGQHGSCRPKIAPCWPHEPCNQGRTMQCLDASNATILGQIWIVFTYFEHNVHLSSGAINVGEVRLQINALFCRNMFSHYGIRSWVFRHFISNRTCISVRAWAC